MIKYLSLFSGIGAFEKALKRVGIEYELVGFSEIDKFAIKSYCAIHNVSEDLNLGDISKINLDELPKDIDLITHGSPCQDFSIAGRLAGGDKGSGTRSSLMWCTVDIVKKAKPKYVIWENVKNLLSSKHRHNFDSYIEVMENLGYNSYFKVLNAKDYGIPQNRERVYTISIRKDIDKEFEFPEKQELKLKLKDLLEETVDKKYYINDGILNNIVSDNQAGFLSGGKWDKINESCRRYYKENGVGPTIHTCQGGNTEPKVAVAMRGRYNMSGKIEQNIEISDREIANSITTVQKDSMVGECLKIKETTKAGYKEAYAGDGVNISGRMKYQKGNVQKEMIQTIMTSGSERGVVTSDMRVRKLTPLECWRLMGFDDSDFYKAQSVPTSNTQLYKQAGNSIVVNVLEAIFKNLFGGD